MLLARGAGHNRQYEQYTADLLAITNYPLNTAGGLEGQNRKAAYARVLCCFANGVLVAVVSAMSAAQYRHFLTLCGVLSLGGRKQHLKKTKYDCGLFRCSFLP